MTEIMKLKVCGMKYNTAEVAALQPDYLGFIFYDQSSRYFEDQIPKISESIKKVGVFVNAKVDEVLEKVKKYNLKVVQLHGDESPEYCKELKRHYEERSDEVISLKRLPLPSLRDRNDKLEIIKVFSIKDKFDFSILEPYEEVCDYYLFDTKGKLPGGNGYAFDWSVLNNYPSTKPYFLSGGIGLNEAENVLSFLRRQESRYCHALDVNSKFEIEPGLKDIAQLKKFKHKVPHSI